MCYWFSACIRPFLTRWCYLQRLPIAVRTPYGCQTISRNIKPQLLTVPVAIQAHVQFSPTICSPGLLPVYAAENRAPMMRGPRRPCSSTYSSSTRNRLDTENECLREVLYWRDPEWKPNRQAGGSQHRRVRVDTRPVSLVVSRLHSRQTARAVHPKTRPLRQRWKLMREHDNPIDFQLCT